MRGPKPTQECSRLAGRPARFLQAKKRRDFRDQPAKNLSQKATLWRLAWVRYAFAQPRACSAGYKVLGEGFGMLGESQHLFAFATGT